MSSSFGDAKNFYLVVYLETLDQDTSRLLNRVGMTHKANLLANMDWINILAKRHMEMILFV